MARALGKGLLIAGVAAAAAVLIAVEAFAFSLVVYDHEAECGPTGARCDLNALAAALTGAGFGLATFVGTAVAGCLVAVGSATGARIAVGSTFALLFVGHLSLLV